MMVQMTRIVELTEEQVDSLIGCQGYLKDKLHVGGTENTEHMPRPPPPRTLSPLPGNIPLYRCSSRRAGGARSPAPADGLTTDPGIGLVKRNLIKTAEASDELSKLMVSKAPAELKAQGEALAQRRNRAFDRALAVYANASGGDDLADGGEDSD